MRDQSERDERQDEWLDDLAHKAAWLLDNGATNEAADLAQNVLDYHRRAQRPEPVEEGLVRESTCGS